MNISHLSAAIFCTSAVVAALALRRLPNHLRILLDVFLFFATSFYLINIGVSPLLDGPNAALDNNLFSLRVVACAWWVLGARVLITLLWFTLHRNSQSRAARLSSDVTAALIYVGAVLVIVKSVLALPLSGLLATSGVLAIVLGLALQNTLGDVFAGIAVGIESPFRVGDRIALPDKLEGQVVQVNWRSVWIQTDDDDVAIIPHSLVAKNQIVNRSYPTQRRSVSVEISCPKSSLPERVIEAALNSTWLCPTIMRMPSPSAVLIRLGRRNHHYSISFYVDGTQGLTSTKGMLLRQCHRQLYYAGLLSNLPADQANCESPGSLLSLPPRLLLRNLILFENLDEKSLIQLVEELHLVELESGETLFTENNSDATLYIVSHGILQLTAGIGSLAAHTLGAIGAGDYVGEIGLLTGAPHAATATALTPCHIYKLSRDAVAPLLAANADLASTFDRSVRRGLRILHREVAARASPSVGTAEQLLARIRRFFHTGTA